MTSAHTKHNTYITTRNFILPRSKTGFHGVVLFNMWKKKRWPYQKLVIGDKLFLYETPTKRFMWLAEVIEILRFQYETKDAASRELQEFGKFSRNEPYFLSAPEKGFCLAYLVKPTKIIDSAKPSDFRFTPLGWLEVNDEIATRLKPISLMVPSDRYEELANGDYFIQLPWESYISRKLPMNHPNSLLEFSQWPDLNKIGVEYLGYTRMINNSLHGNWMKSWQEIYVLGPFIKQRRRKNIVCIILVAVYNKPYRHLFKISQLLVEPFLEFKFMPKIYIIDNETKENLEQMDHPSWLYTKKMAIRLQREPL